MRRQRIEPHRQCVELRLPIAAVAVEPERGLKDRASVEAAAADPAATFLGHQPGAHQDLNVARYCLQRNVKRGRQLGDQQVFTIKLVEYLAPDRVRKRSEHRVEHRVVCVHTETLYAAAVDNQLPCL